MGLAHKQALYALGNTGNKLWEMSKILESGPEPRIQNVERNSGRVPGNVEKSSGKCRKKFWILTKKALDPDPECF